MCYCDVDSYPEFFSDNSHVAKKQHKCSECRGPIYPGEKYRRRSGKWDGEVRSYTQCIACCDLEDYVKAHVPCMCSTFTYLYEDVQDAVCYAEKDGVIPGFRFAILRKAALIKRRRNGYNVTHGTKVSN